VTAVSFFYLQFAISSSSFTMKLFLVCIATLAALSAAFAPSATNNKASFALNAEVDRKAFIAAASFSVFGTAITSAMAMDQDNVNDPTEVWETGSPNASAEKARMARYQNARTQLTSNFPPIKRLTLERKSPVVCHLWCFRE
jgi:hypothetical protein